jgi:hypothetical protein
MKIRGLSAVEDLAHCRPPDIRDRKVTVKGAEVNPESRKFLDKTARVSW